MTEASIRKIADLILWHDGEERQNEFRRSFLRGHLAMAEFLNQHYPIPEHWDVTSLHHVYERLKKRYEQR